METRELGMDRPIGRREFVLKTLAGTAAAAGAIPALGAEDTSREAKAKRSAIDRVVLGKSGVKPTRLGIGTGSNGGAVQREIGQESFTRLLRHAYDRGVRFIDTADMYRIHEMVGKAIKDLPRGELVIQSKMMWEPIQPPKPLEVLDRFRKELGVETIDILLIHCAQRKNWPEDLKRMRDAFSEAKEKGIIRAHGVSCHGLPALREVAACGWVDVNLARCNHRGHHMDGATGKWSEASIQDDAVAELKKIHTAGKGVIGMKIVGNGDFKEAADREKSVRYAMTAPFIDAVVIGVKSPAEVDEAIDRLDRALNA